MALPVFNAATTGTAAGASSVTFSHTPAGADRLLSVGVSIDNRVVNSVTFGGTGLTSVSSATNGAQVAHLWRLIAPAASAQNVVVTLSGGGSDIIAVATSYTGVDQTTPLGTPATATGTSTTASVAVTSATDELVVDCVSSNLGTLTVGAGQTERGNAVAGDNQGGSSTEPGAASVTMSWTIGSSSAWASVGVSIKGVAATVITDTIDSASFVLTAATVGSLNNRVTQAASAAFIITAATVGSAITYSTPAESASFVLTPATISSLNNRVTQADSASFVLTASAVGSLNNHVTPIDSASFVITASDVGSNKSFVTPADSASFALTAASVGSLFNHASQIDSATFTLTVSDVGSTKSYTTTVDSASFTLTASSIGSLYNHVTPIDSASFAITANAVGSLFNYVSQIASASFVITASDITSTYNPISLGTVARPNADTAAGGWLPSTGTSLFAMIDEVVADDTDYIFATTATTCTLALSPVADPLTSSGQVVEYRAWSPTGTGGVTMRLKQGAVVIASWTHAAGTLPTVPTAYQQVLTAAQCDAITDYTNLFVEPVAL